MGQNTKFLVKRAYARMELLRQISNFTSSVKDKIHIYKTYIRSVVEQKVAVSIITKSTESYSDKLKELNLETLKERRNILSARFAEKCIKNEKTKSIFKKKTLTYIT